MRILVEIEVVVDDEEEGDDLDGKTRERERDRENDELDDKIVSKRLQVCSITRTTPATTTNNNSITKCRTLLRMLLLLLLLFHQGDCLWGPGSSREKVTTGLRLNTVSVVLVLVNRTTLLLLMLTPSSKETKARTSPRLSGVSSSSSCLHLGEGVR